MICEQKRRKKLKKKYNGRGGERVRKEEEKKMKLLIGFHLKKFDGVSFFIIKFNV